MNVEYKRCNRCDDDKPIDEFSKRTASKDGLNIWCKKCVAEYDKKYRKKNIKRILIREKKYRKDNTKRIAKYKKEYAKIKAKKIAKRMKMYYQENAEKIKKRVYINYREKIKTDPVFKLNANISLRMRQSLKCNKNGRHWENLVGYTLFDLKQHLNNTMPKDYTWDDYLKGKLHLDHRIPISIFNITSVKCKGFKKCWKLENLRLLTASENLKKGKKLFY